jgi:hypothetical protein
LKQYTGICAAFVFAVTAGGVLYLRPAAGGPPAETPKTHQERDGGAGAPTWKERLILRGYAGSAYGEFSPDGRLFATVDSQHVLRFLDTATWKERSRCPLTKYPNGTYFPQWHPFSADNRLFVLAWRVPVEGRQGKPRFETWLIEASTGKVRTVLQGSEPRFSPTGNHLALYREGALVLYDHAVGTEARLLPTGARSHGAAIGSLWTAGASSFPRVMAAGRSGMLRAGRP